MQKGKIGIFDSGFGGLSILKEIVRELPQYDYIYLGDTARTPYGSRSQETICEFTKEGVDFLFQNDAELIVLACNSASSEALRIIQQEYLPTKYPDKRVLGVVIPGAEEAARVTRNKKVAVLGTEATIHSGVFEREMQKINPEIKVHAVAAPLLVPLVEAGEEQGESAKLLVSKYVSDALSEGADTLVLGCTHYGFLEEEIKKNAPNVTVISEGKVVAGKLEDYLRRHNEIENRLSKEGNREFFTTDAAEKFDKLGSRFFSEAIKSKQTNI